MSKHLSKCDTLWLQVQHSEFNKALACRVDWKISNNTNTNYANQGFVSDANVGFGRNLGNKDTIQVRTT